MKIAVIGGGTAGYMAAAQMTKFFPQFELYHIFDSTIPTIGVGEGTIPSFPVWLQAITQLPFETIQQQCFTTKKFRISFENWGKIQPQFDHDFGRARYGYHISAAKVVELLSQYVQATYLDKKVQRIDSQAREATIHFSDQTQLTVNLVFDASGFPKTLDESQHIRLEAVPTNAAFIRQGPVVPFNTATRSVARPHGWIFIIPLTSHTTYGYIYNEQISSKAEVQADMAEFLQTQHVTPFDMERSLRFPSFVHRHIFDGVVFKIGNAASFLEPLEATALAVVLHELQIASYWLADGMVGISGEERWYPQPLEIINRQITTAVQQIGLFVGWHYAKGSQFDSPFWDFAVTNYHQAVANLSDDSLRHEFSQILQAGETFPIEYLPLIKEPESFKTFVVPKLQLTSDFGGIMETSFAQVGRGIGYY